MGEVQRGVVRPPNEMFGGIDQRRSMVPAAGPSTVHEPNQALRDGAAGGSGPLARSASPVSTPDHRFDVGQAQMGQPQSAIQPGTGAVPIYAFGPTGVPNRAVPESDSAKK